MQQFDYENLIKLWVSYFSVFNWSTCLYVLISFRGIKSLIYFNGLAVTLFIMFSLSYAAYICWRFLVWDHAKLISNFWYLGNLANKREIWRFLNWSHIRNEWWKRELHLINRKTPLIIKLIRCWAHMRLVKWLGEHLRLLYFPLGISTPIYEIGASWNLLKFLEINERDVAVSLK